jgi:hypothetical protein
MPFGEVYRRQVQLLVRTLPLVAQEECFALKCVFQSRGTPVQVEDSDGRCQQWDRPPSFNREFNPHKVPS